MGTLAEQWDLGSSPDLVGLNPNLADRVQQAKDAYKKQFGKDLPITSGFRTTEQQAALASKPNKYPVAKAGTSLHETGDAIDVDKNVPDEFLKQFGLYRPLGEKDPVHVTMMPQPKSGSLATLWDQTPVEEKTQPEAKTAIEKAFEFKKKSTNKLAGLGEAALSGLTGLVAPVAGAVAGIGGALASGHYGTQEGVKAGEQLGGKVQEALTYQPRTEEGKGYLEALNKALDAAHLPPIMPEALHLAPEAGPIVGEVGNLYKAGQRLKQEIMPEMQQQFAAKGGLQSAGAAATGNKAILDAAIAHASPALKEELLTVDPNKYNPEALNRHLEADSLPIPVTLTEGQALQDPNLISKERNERGVKEQFVERLNQQNKDLMANAQAIKERSAPDVFTTDYVDDASNLIDIGKKIKQENVSKTQQAYKDLEAKAGGKFPIDAQLFGKNALGSLMAKEDIDFLPSTIGKLVKEYASGDKQMTFDGFENLRTKIANETRKAQASNDGNAVHALSLVRQELENLPMNETTKEVKQAADIARSTAKADFDLERNNDFYNKIVNGKADTKDAIQSFVIRSKNADFKNTLDLLSSDPKALQHLRSGTLDFLIRESTDASGNFSVAKFNKNIEKIDVDGKLQPLFGEETGTLRNLVKTGRYIEARPKGSFVNESNTFVQGLKSLAASGLEKTANVGLGAGVIPVGSLAREALQKRSATKSANESLKAGAGIKKKD